MAWFAAALPLITAGLSAAGTVAAGKQDENALKMQAIVARQQALADEETQRRENREYRGRAAAALAESGLSPDGSSGLLVDQNSALGELDALNIRYHGMLRGKSLDSEAADTRRASNMLAGQQLLQGYGNYYRPRGRGQIAQAA